MLGLEEREASARPVVLVWAPPELPRDEESFTQLQRDTRRATTLDHPHIVKVHGLATLEHGLARVVEYVDGESLRDVLEHTGALPPGIAGRIAVDAALGIHYAHVAGNDDGTPLIHGDLRPETVMLAFSGRAKVGGYGALAVAPKEPRGQRVLNRRRYCAPEQIIGGRAAQTPQTDVFLLGLLLFECITGRMPWDKATDFDDAVMNAPLPVDGLSPAVQALIRKATAKRASERYKTALAFRDAVDEALAPAASPAEMAQLLEQHFPAQDSPRAARKQVLDAAMEAHARAWAQTPRTEPGSESPTVLLSARQLADLEPPPRNWRAAMPLVFSFGVASALAGVFWYQTRHAVPRPMLVVPPGQEQAAHPSRRPAVAPAPPSPSSAPLPAGPAATAQAPLTPPGAAPSVVPAPASSAPVAAAVTPPVAKASASGPEILTTGIDLFTEPALDASLDGKPAGRTPLVIGTKPGRHVLTLSDRSRGINQTRVVMVGREGVTPLRLSLGKGTLSVRAPAGANVFVDGRAMGASPLQDMHLYEGSHHIKVTLGDAVWQQDFKLQGEQTLRFDVELKPSSGG
jgi:eukaryotic-like serine/threonine-protein kinase